jgi:urea transport system permease protein
MFTLQVGFMSPSFVGIVPSIEMVIYAAVGGRLSLVGAVYGALLVNAGKTLFSENFPDLWLFLMAGLFIGVTMAFPMGLAGLFESHIKPWWKKRMSDRKTQKARLAAAHASYPDVPPPPKPPKPKDGSMPSGVSGQNA